MLVRIQAVIKLLSYDTSNTGLFISPSGISDPCGTVAGTVTPKGSMSSEGEALQIFCPTLQVLDMCTLGDAADVNPEIKFLRHATAFIRRRKMSMYVSLLTVLPHAAIPVNFTTKFREHLKLLL
jgi:hypothetical protein